ncbi:acyl carrier protein [Saccharothrix syringae]|uniref:Acyl carrier protein n=1 Tax=Saccharothrix syringae TaxID=103733 RepID=A0A5Q0H530_SACSY|nr:acyl carrier protein [Saccharothrix syringae]QFZ20985.1 acyl carrier protein [Saccharothrix syringae]
MSDVTGELLAVVTAEVGRAVDADTDLFAAGLMSSLVSLEIVTRVERRYGIDVNGDDLDLENFRTVEAMAALVDRLRAVRGTRSAP